MVRGTRGRYVDDGRRAGLRRIGAAACVERPRAAIDSAPIDPYAVGHGRTIRVSHHIKDEGMKKAAPAKKAAPKKAAAKKTTKK